MQTDIRIDSHDVAWIKFSHFHQVPEYPLSERCWIFRITLAFVVRIENGLLVGCYPGADVTAGGVLSRMDNVNEQSGLMIEKVFSISISYHAFSR